MSAAAVRLEAEPVAGSAPRRYRATCPVCGYAAARAKRDAAVHVVAQHVAYSHGMEVARS